MVKRYLVTTADEHTWPKGKPVLFLGEWCRRYSRKSEWKGLDADLESYHWDNRTKLHADYQYLQELYEKSLADLSQKLNQIHSVEYSQRYWRILVGPWLICFIQILFDRWFMLKQAIEGGEADRCKIKKRSSKSFVPMDMMHFNQLYTEDDWNEALYGELIKDLWIKELVIEEVFIKQQDAPSCHKRNSSYRYNWKKYLKKISLKVIYNLNKIRVNGDDFFFISSYLPLKTDFMLQFKLGQFPKKWFSVPYLLNAKLDVQKRQWKVKSCQNDDIFSKISGQMIAKHIPIAYLEGYKELVNEASKLAWPKKPKAIFTSNSYFSDDLFKCWAAEKVENGSPLIIGQHGGNFGMTPFASHEEHQIKIADKWLSWGWHDTKRKQIVPIGNLKASEYTVRNNPKGKAIMVNMTLPRYSYYLYSVPIAGQWLRYFDDQKFFFKALPKEFHNKVLLRIYHQDYGWDQLNRWENDMPSVCIDHGKRSFHKMVSDSRIFIGTYNATTYLETLAWNIPTIVFWNRDHWEIKNELEPVFLLLKKAKILHDTPEEAAHHLVKVWDEMDQWWMSDIVQKARKDFCDIFSYRNDKLLDDCNKLFNEYR